MKEKKQASLSSKRKIGNLITYIVLSLISIVWLIPFVCLLLQSFRSYIPGVEAAGGGTGLAGGMVTYLIPKVFSFDNYTWLFSGDSNFLQWYLNTFIIAFFVALIQTIIVLCTSYALSRMRFKGRQMLMKFWLVLGMFPGFLTMICLYFILKQIGLTYDGAIGGLILVSVASSGMMYYVCKGYMDTIPKALDEAARIDGASRARVFFIMTIPMCKPIVIYTALTAFMAPWCDFMFAKMIANNNALTKNVAVGMWDWIWNQDYSGYFTRFCAGGILVAVPITILFLCLQKYYVEGVTGGAVKG